MLAGVGTRKNPCIKNCFIVQCCCARGLRFLGGSEEKVSCVCFKRSFFQSDFWGLIPYALGKAQALTGLKWSLVFMWDLLDEKKHGHRQDMHSAVWLAVHLRSVDRQSFNRKEEFGHFPPRETSAEVVVFVGVVSLAPVQPPERQNKAFSVESTSTCLQTFNKRIIHFLLIIQEKPPRHRRFHLIFFIEKQIFVWRIGLSAEHPSLKPFFDLSILGYSRKSSDKNWRVPSFRWFFINENTIMSFIPFILESNSISQHYFVAQTPNVFYKFHPQKHHIS